MFVKFQSLLMALYLFFAGFIYGDAPINMKFTCDIPTEVYEYEAGDTFKVHVTSENVGRPFKAVTFDSLDVYIYQVVGDKSVPLEDTDDDGFSLPWMPPEELIKKGYTSEGTFSFTVSENAPKGDYIIMVSQFGDREYFEGMVTII